MRIVVVGGTGLIGSKVVERLSSLGSDVIAAARSTGVNSYTGEGLERVLDGTETVIDLSNSSYTAGASISTDGRSPSCGPDQPS
jgi:uncharacterized protein YbjT (DUF2867 family)